MLFAMSMFKHITCGPHPLRLLVTQTSQFFFCDGYITIPRCFPFLSTFGRRFAAAKRTPPPATYSMTRYRRIHSPATARTGASVPEEASRRSLLFRSASPSHLAQLTSALSLRGLHVYIDPELLYPSAHVDQCERKRLLARRSRNELQFDACFL